MVRLRMRRPDLKGLGEVILPDGYQIRTYKEGDDDAWVAIIRRTLGSHWNRDRFKHNILNRSQFRPEGLIFVTYNNEPVGTACAWAQFPDEEEMGYIHMVGVVPEHQGKHLGYALCLSVLHFLKKSGFRYASLNTDDFRLPAIKTYLNLGFEPDYVNEDHRIIWEEIISRLSRKRC